MQVNLIPLIFLSQVLALAVAALGWLIDKRNLLFRSRCNSTQGFNKLRTSRVLYFYDFGFKELCPVIERELESKDSLKIERIELGEGGLASYMEKPEWSGVSYDLKVVFSNGEDKKFPLNIDKAIEDYYYPEKVKKEKWAAALFWGGLFVEFVIVCADRLLNVF
jgi:hypothetical protein